MQIIAGSLKLVRSIKNFKLFETPKDCLTTKKCLKIILKRKLGRRKFKVWREKTAGKEKFWRAAYQIWRESEF